MLAFFLIYETSKPLDSADDAHDFSLRVGDTIGWQLSVLLAVGAPGSQVWVKAFFPPTYGDIVISTPIVLSVNIDIKPNGVPNSINLESKGVIPVAILTTNDFDATTVDPLSVEFGPSGATESHGQGHIEDVDDGGDLDLLLHFRTQETGIQCGDTAAALTGETFDGKAVEGSDSIWTVNCD